MTLKLSVLYDLQYVFYNITSLYISAVLQHYFYELLSVLCSAKVSPFEMIFRSKTLILLQMVHAGVVIY